MMWDVMKKRLDELPRAQKKVARYMLDNPSESIFMTSQQLGERSKTSEATVIRLAFTLGFRGFPEFKEALQVEAKDQLSTFGRLKKHRLRVHQGNLLADVIGAEMEKAASMLEQTDDSEIRELASRICASQGVYIVGLRSARSLAIYLQYYLSWFLPNVYTPERDYLESYLVSAPRDSLVIGVSFPRYTRATLECIRMASRMGFRTAAITDCKSSPLAEAAEMSVIAPNVHVAHIDSLMIPLAMANAILVEVADQLGPKALKRLDELEHIWADADVYC